MPLTSVQLKTLQTLWRPFACQARFDGEDRAARLRWASGTIGREIHSFSDLQTSEAALLIDTMKKALAQESSRPRPGRRTARMYGTAGRRGHVETEIRLVDADTLRLVETLREEIGWTREQLDTFLHSSRSPVKSGSIRTLAEANRVIWALKGIRRRAARPREEMNAAAKVPRLGAAVPSPSL